MISKSFDEAERMGLSISKSNGYRTKRPKRRRSKTWGHGYPKQIIAGWKEKLKDKKPPEHVTRIAVPPVPAPDFLKAMLMARPEARRLQTVESYVAIKNQG